MRAPIVAALMLLVAACAPPAPKADPAAIASIDPIARDYVSLILEIGEREEGYVDAYYGPAELQAAAKADPRTPEQLRAGAADLTARLNAVPDAGLDAASLQRKKYLLAHVAAADARLRMIGGEKLGFADEAQALFGIRPELKPLSDYDAVLARIEADLPGEGALADRLVAFKQTFVIPKDKLDVVMRRAIAECRTRTVRHIALPANETFTLAFVGDKPWSGYNYFQGGAASKIEINADFPIYTERAIDLGCHEGYPGHHVYNALLEKTFVTDRGWIEMSVYPLFSPMSFVAEGSANYGIDLAFPGDEAVAFERDVLAPLAGIAPTADFAKKAELAELTRELARSEYTIADDYLSGRVGRDESIARLAKYGLTTREKATQRLRFIDTYGSYIINYGLGRDTVQAWVERQGADHWKGMETLLASQILPVDLID